MQTAHPGRAKAANEPNRCSVFELANSTVVVERSPAGPTARIEQANWVEYAGPLPKGTVQSLEEVAHGD